MFSAQDLAAFVAVADSGSIHAAASVLNRTQPAVTQAIQRLEEAVGFELLDRSGYRVQLTERGKTFVKRARVAVKQAQDLRAFANVLSRGVEARLRIGIHGAIQPSAWMHLIEDLPQHFPDTVIEVQTGEGDAPLRRLMCDELDLAIVLTAAPDLHAMGVVYKALGEMEFVTIVHAQRRTANVEQDLAQLPQILVADFDDPATSYGVAEGHRYWRVADHQLKAAVIRAGSGWGSVPLWTVESAVADGQLTLISYRGMGERSTRPFFIYRKRDTTLGPVASFIWDRCQSQERVAQR